MTRAILTLAAIAAGGCAAVAQPGSAAAPETRYPVQVAAVATSATGAASLVVPGTLEPAAVHHLIAPGDGPVEQLAVVDGQAVVPGQELLRIDGRRLGLELLRAEADLRRARYAAEAARASESRRLRLVAGDAGLVSEEERQASAAKADQAVAETERAEAAVALAALAVERSILRAPCAGTVVGLDLASGQRVAAGRRLLGVLQSGPPLVAFRMPADVVGRIAVGDRIVVRPGGGAAVPGVIEQVAPTADASRQVAVRARLLAEGPRPGGLALVQVRLPLGSGAAVPRSALRASDRGLLAFVHADGLVRQRLVETGLTADDGWCEILTGLVPGEPVVVAGVDALRDGARVRIVAGP